jgi:hypothetical protein
MRNHIDSWKHFSFITGVFALVDANHFNKGEWLRDKIKKQRKVVNSYANAFDDTINMPCGFQDAAGERLDHAGQEYMQLVHAYLICRYGKLTKRLAEMLEYTIVEWKD